MAPITLPSATTLLHRAAAETTTLLLRGRQVIVTDGGSTTSGSSSNDDDPTDAKTLSGGAIAGIVIGSIAGLLLLIWIFRSCSNLGAPPNAPPNPGGRAWYDGVGGQGPAPRSRSREPRRSHSRRGSGGHHHHHSRHSHSRHRSGSRGYREAEVVEVGRPVAVVPVRGGRTDRYEERRSRSRSHSRARY